MAFFDDTKQLVAEGVHSDVAHHILEASPKVKIVEVQHGNTKEENLKKWLKMETPLTYRQCDEGETFSVLLLAVVSKEKDLKNRLSNRGKVPMFKAAFVDILLLSPSSSALISAPVLKNGSFHLILLEVHHHLCSFSEDRTPTDQCAFIYTHFIHAVDHLKIWFISFHMPLSHPHNGEGGGGDGAPWLKLIFNAWHHLVSGNHAQIFPCLYMCLLFPHLNKQWLMPMLLHLQKI